MLIIDYCTFDSNNCLVSLRLIAIMLGRLRMGVPEAITAYGQLAKHVFSEKKWTFQDGTFKASRLEEAVKQLLEGKGKGPDERMLDESEDGNGVRGMA